MRDCTYKRPIAATPLLAAAALLAATPGLAQERVRFIDASVSSGLSTFNHRSYTLGGDGLAGAAWFDYNNDGWLDVYLTNGQDIVTPGLNGYPNALFENQGDGSFVEVAAAKGLIGGTGNAGVIAGDIDNDGDQDLFLTGDGGMLGFDHVLGLQTVDSGVALYINNGAPEFDYQQADLAAAGLVGFESTMSAAFGDIDSDGRLDLFVTAPGTRPLGCNPPIGCNAGDPTIKLHSSRLYLNRSNGGVVRFKDVTTASGVGANLSGSLATTFTDYNRDGRMDLLVADGVLLVYEPTPLRVFRNDGYDTALGSVIMQEVSDALGTGRDGAWMGLALADFDGDLASDIFMTNLGNDRPHALYRWIGSEGSYRDVSDITQVSKRDPGPSDYFGWGTTAQDFDRDGRVDLFFTGSPPPLEGNGPNNPGILLMNDPPGARFVEYSDNTSVDTSMRYTSGLAAADYDNDGGVDLLIATDDWNSDNGTPVLLRNQTDNANDWITVRLTGNGQTTNADAVGARVVLIAGLPGAWSRQMREVLGGSSFLSMDSRWLTFGLGELPAGAFIRVAVDWPDGPNAPGGASPWQLYGPFPANGFADITQN